MVAKYKIVVLVTFVVFALAVNGCKSHHDKKYNIVGSITNPKEGSVKLVRFKESDHSSEAIDSAQIKDGKFNLSGAIENPTMVSLVVYPGNLQMEFFIENNEIFIDLDTLGTQYYDESDYGGEKGGRFTKFKVKGSKSDEEYRTYENNDENKRFRAFLNASNRDHPELNAEDQERLNLESDSIRKLYNTWEENWITEFAQKNPNSVVGPYLYKKFIDFSEQTSLEKMESVIKMFKGQALESEYFQILNNNFRKRMALSPGNTAPDFTALNADSIEFKFSSTRGSYVLIDFWASWCIPCRKSIPHWKDVYKKYHNKGLEIVGVSDDSRWEDWQKALKQENMPWIQLVDDFPIKNMPARIGTLYMVRYLPTYVLLDPNGKVILYNGRKEEVTREIEKRLK